MTSSLTVAGGGFEFSLPSVGGTWSWTVLATNVQGPGQNFQFINVQTPYGSLYTAAIPIPGEVIAGMADSLLKVKQQLAPLMQLVSPIPAVFDITITEGDPSTFVGSVKVQNNGSFGSFMSVTATPDSPFLSCSPSTVSSVGFSQTAQFSVQLNPAILVGGTSAVGRVNLQDNRVPSTLVPIVVNVTVLPRPTISLSPNTAVLTFSLLTGTPGGGQPVSVTNSGPAGSSLNFTVAKVQNNSPWLEFSPTSGGPLTSGDSTSFIASVVPGMVPYAVGTYMETLRVSSPNASNGFVDVAVTLLVT